MLDRRRLLLSAVSKPNYKWSFKTNSDAEKFYLPSYFGQLSYKAKVIFPSGAEITTRKFYVDLSLESGIKTIEMTMPLTPSNDNNGWANSTDRQALIDMYDIPQEDEGIISLRINTYYVNIDQKLTEIGLALTGSGTVDFGGSKLDIFDLRGFRHSYQVNYRNSRATSYEFTKLYIDDTYKSAYLSINGSRVDWIPTGNITSLTYLACANAYFLQDNPDFSGLINLVEFDAFYFRYRAKVLDLSNSPNIKKIRATGSGVAFDVILPQTYNLNHFEIDTALGDLTEPKHFTFTASVIYCYFRGARYNSMTFNHPLATTKLNATGNITNLLAMTNLEYLEVNYQLQSVTDFSLLSPTVKELRISGEGGHDYSGNSVIEKLRHTHLTRATTDLSGMSSLYSIYISFPDLETTIIIPPTNNIVNYIDISVGSPSGGSSQSILDTLDLALDSTITNGTYRWRGGSFNGSPFPQDVKDKVDLLIAKGWDAKVEKGGEYTNPKQVYP